MKEIRFFIDGLLIYITKSNHIPVKGEHISFDLDPDGDTYVVTKTDRFFNTCGYDKYDNAIVEEEESVEVTLRPYIEEIDR